MFAKWFLCLFYKTKLYLCSTFSHVCVTDKLDWASVLVTSWIESCHWRAIWENNNQNTKLLYNFNVHYCQYNQTLTGVEWFETERMKKVYFPLYDKAWPSRSTTSGQSHLAVANENPLYQLDWGFPQLIPTSFIRNSSIMINAKTNWPYLSRRTWGSIWVNSYWFRLLALLPKLASTPTVQYDGNPSQSPVCVDMHSDAPI